MALTVAGTRPSMTPARRLASMARTMSPGIWSCGSGAMAISHSGWLRCWSRGIRERYTTSYSTLMVRCPRLPTPATTSPTISSAPTAKRDGEIRSEATSKAMGAFAAVRRMARLMDNSGPCPRARSRHAFPHHPTPMAAPIPAGLTSSRSISRAGPCIMWPMARRPRTWEICPRARLCGVIATV